MEDFIKAINSGNIDGNLKYALILNLIFSTFIFILSKLIHTIKDKKDILEIQKYSLINYLKWSLGSVLVCFILLICKLITYNIFSILIIAFAWDTAFIKMQGSASNNTGISDNISKNNN